jgi:hypothetical protein
MLDKGCWIMDAGKLMLGMDSQRGTRDQNIAHRNQEPEHSMSLSGARSAQWPLVYIYIYIYKVISVGSSLA